MPNPSEMAKALMAQNATRNLGTPILPPHFQPHQYEVLGPNSPDVEDHQHDHLYYDDPRHPFAANPALKDFYLGSHAPAMPLPQQDPNLGTLPRALGYFDIPGR